MDPEPVGDVNFDVMFTGVENHAIRCVFHVCELREIAVQTRLIEFKVIDDVDDLANYTDKQDC